MKQMKLTYLVPSLAQPFAEFWKWQLTSVFLPGESQEQGAWWAAVYGVAQSRTRLKRLSSSSSSSSREGPEEFSYRHALFDISNFTIKELNVTGFRPRKPKIALAPEHLVKGSLLYFFLSEENRSWDRSPHKSVRDY